VGSSPIRTILFVAFGFIAKPGLSYIYLDVVSRLIRLAVRTPRCGRGNPGSNPGLDIFLYLTRTIENFFCSCNHCMKFLECPSSSVGRAPAF
jgi:hypothetical protein